MAHIITNIGWNNAVSDGKTILLSCMHNCSLKKAECSDTLGADKISQSIERSVQARKMLDADIFERNNRILQSAEAKKNIL